MTTIIKTSLLIQKSLLTQAETLARQLHISRSQLFEMALENYIKSSQSQAVLDESDTQPAIQSGEQRVINQGDVYWVQLGATDDDAEAGIPHPHVVIQDNVFNHSRIPTIVACALTSNIKRTNMPGNLLLEVGEANLPRQSIVEVSKVSTVDKAQLGEYIGSLSEHRIHQILAGMRFLQSSFFSR
jgi:mRNA interferase MazF